MHDAMVMESSTAPEADDELLRQMRSGDEQAFVALYRRLQGPIYRFALQMTGGAAVAEDVVQEVFLALIGSNCGYDVSRGSLSAYLFGIARKLILRHLERSRTAAEETIEGEPGKRRSLAHPDPMAAFLHNETMDGLRRAVVSLPKRYREVVVLCDLEELDYTQAAKLLGCPIGTVRSRLHRARGLLLEKLQQKRAPVGDAGAWKPVRSLT
ncbi:MAG TPA: RNA polymerase sigma factor [Bryobacteraceae bacterium]|jgi:RNA polymerase sigma-70 factor (ECF subfamily)|nr:RNA polymerase sigma factor [Bryobacteraceae bacterium]